MKYKLADGGILSLKDLTDSEYAQAGHLASLDVCPTCRGREIRDAGFAHWQSDGYLYQGERHECNCQLQMALYARYHLAGIGDKYMRLDWTNFHGVEKADQWVKDYIEKWQNFRDHGIGLVFSSQSLGVGKTWSASHIAKELIKLRQKVYFLDFVKMVDAFCGSPEEKSAMERRMLEPTFLFIDDVRAGISERQTDLYALKFEVVIRHRTNFNLPTIFTTNLTEGGFEEAFPRIHSLLYAQQMWVEMSGADYRKRTETFEEIMYMALNGEVAPVT